METTDVRANGLRFHVRTEGSGDRLALCLHGFPEIGHSFRHQLPILAAHGYRAWAPDLRGYGRSERPPRTRDYAIELLLDDVAGLVEAAGASRATLVGHDWGGVIAWLFAMRRPELVERLVVLNTPHPAPLARELRHARQLARFWYIALFQLPRLPERLLAEGHRVDNIFLRHASDPTRFREEDLAAYREAAGEPGALRAMLSYYRAFVRGGGGLRQLRSGFCTISAPTLLVWGEKDAVFGRETVIGTSEWVEDLTVRYLADAGHFVHEEAPEAVNAMLAAWLEGRPVPEVWELDRARRAS